MIGDGDDIQPLLGHLLEQGDQFALAIFIRQKSAGGLFVNWAPSEHGIACDFECL